MKCQQHFQQNLAIISLLKPALQIILGGKNCHLSALSEDLMNALFKWMDAALGKQKIWYHLIYLHASLLSSSRGSCRPEHMSLYPDKTPTEVAVERFRDRKSFLPRKSAFFLGVRKHTSSFLVQQHLQDANLVIFKIHPQEGMVLFNQVNNLGDEKEKATLYRHSQIVTS